MFIIARFLRQIREALIGKLRGITRDNFVMVRTSFDPDAAAKDYAEKLFRLGKKSLDLLLLGMGPDGHTCSLFPGHPLLNETKLTVVPITDSPKPPAQRITLTYPVLNAAKAVAFVCTGEGKREVVKAILEDGADYPAARVRPEGENELYWILDQPAASLLSQ